MSLVFFAFRFLCFISFIFLGPRKHISYASYPRAQYIVKPTLQEVIFSSLLHTSITCHQVTCHDKKANERILSKSQINRCRDIQRICDNSFDSFEKIMQNVNWGKKTMLGWKVSHTHVPLNIRIESVQERTSWNLKNLKIKIEIIHSILVQSLSS